MENTNQKINYKYTIFRTEVVKEFETYEQVDKYMCSLSEEEYRKHLFHKQRQDENN